MNCSFTLEEGEIIDANVGIDNIDSNESLLESTNICGENITSHVCAVSAPLVIDKENLDPLSPLAGWQIRKIVSTTGGNSLKRLKPILHKRRLLAPPPLTTMSRNKKKRNESSNAKAENVTLPLDKTGNCKHYKLKIWNSRKNFSS